MCGPGMSTSITVSEEEGRVVPNLESHFFESETFQQVYKIKKT